MSSASRSSPLRVLSRVLSTAAVVALLLLFALNIPFYAGASIGESTSWRMEHGRLTIRRSPLTRSSSLWIDGNSEGVRWAPAWRRAGPGEWSVTVPLWMPLAAAAAWCAASWARPRRERPGG